MTPTRRRLWWAAVWLLAAVLLFAALEDLDWRAVVTLLRTLTAGRIVVLATINVGIVLLLGARWWLILNGLGNPIPLLAAAGYRLAAFGISYFTPGPHFGGEPLQVALAVRRQGVPAGKAAASVVLDKLFELASNFAVLGIGVYSLVSSGLVSGRAGSLGLGVTAGLFALPVLYLALLAAGGRPLAAIGEGLLRVRRFSFLERLAGLAGTTEAEAGAFIRDRKAGFILAVLLSAMIWAAMILEFSLAVRFLGLELSLWETVAVIAAARIAILLPVPAGLGAIEAALVLATQALGEPASAGAGLSLLVRVRDTAFGLAGLWLGRKLYGKPRVRWRTGNASSES